MSETILDRIIERKRAEIHAGQQHYTIGDFEAMAENQGKARGFAAALYRSVAEHRPAVIAEIKKASPSKGVIREDFDPVDIARRYEEAGASALSVLTDEEFFQGHEDYLRAARNAVTLPVLRKDFMIDPWQIFQSRAMGADAVLLIVAALSDAQLDELYHAAQRAGCDVLVEVHSAEELERAMKLNIELVGINNRDLRTFETRLDTSLSLADEVPADRLVITESGIHSREDVRLMRDNGINGFLVGEAFMKAGDPGAALKALFF
ncbi:indole-3-glycerol phosphate synthase TrpC [Alloalcanivorax profundimaris]|uniref:indole-3-glycerol phosphate synthase TrpC n=1 Tax=Alloalcanivorax profundimaris TaxID=2735259 RepID=UPI0018887ABD|nr:indole-3-glycerol phosphate synthase TrpC [Alloalcanivorax profundimaris]MBF1802137.1 indole-3-glycerol phosphate synthase TrpC [Alloalcanivorax profundimaris]